MRWVGDYVAFVVAETRHQAADAAELIEVDYEPLPAVVSTEDAAKPGTPLVWDEAPDNISFVYLGRRQGGHGRRLRRCRRTSSSARFVINRVTAATMEPRGSIGDYNAAEGRYTIYTTLQRTHAYRAEISNILGCRRAGCASSPATSAAASA